MSEGVNSVLKETTQHLRDQLKMKQNDWIEACKEVDSLRAKLEIAVKTLNELANWDNREDGFHKWPMNPVAQKARTALNQLGYQVGTQSNKLD